MQVMGFAVYLHGSSEPSSECFESTKKPQDLCVREMRVKTRIKYTYSDQYRVFLGHYF